MIINYKLKPLVVAVALVFSMQTQADDMINAGNHNPSSSTDNNGSGVLMNSDPCAHNKRNIGITVGAIAGAIIGNLASKGKHKALGIILGGVAGAGLGGFIGSELDNRQCELSKIQKRYDADIQTTPIKISAPDMATAQTNEPVTPNDAVVGLSVNVVDKNNEPQFDSGSDVLTAKSQAMFTEIAVQYKPQTGVDAASNKAEVAALNRRVLLIGHTDDTGNSSQNAELSERRAKNVATLFKNAGVPENQMYYQGAGETMPQADNATETGRAQNRRVEIVDLSNDENFNTYLQNRRPNTEYYRPVEPQTTIANQEQPAKKITKKLLANNKPALTGANKKLAPKIEAKPINVPAAANDLQQANFIDFGGLPVNNQNVAINIGELPTKSKFEFFIKEAQASDMQHIASCNLDRPRSAGSVMALKGGKVYATNEHLPGLNGRTWQDTVNDHLIVLNNVAVLRDGATLENKPDLKVYSNYNSSQNRNPKPDVFIKPDVNVYQGSNGVLYRVFAKDPQGTQDTQGMQCMDILMPLKVDGAAKSGISAISGKVIYGLPDNLQVADFIPKMAK